MKKLTFIISLFLCLILSTGQVWATDANMIAGTNGSVCTVNSKDGIKVGTSSKGGDMSIIVGAGATKLTFYAAAWKGVSGLSLNISGATTDPTSISLTADAGITSNSPFTLSGSAADFKHEITLSDIDAETTITFTSSIAKRFVVWGATYETGTSGGGDPEPGGGDDPEPSETPTCETPTFDQEDGKTFDESIEVTISAESGATIHYTTDGTTPTTSSSVYSSALTFTETTTLKAIAVKTGSNNSAVASATYTKVVSIPGYSIDFENDLDAYIDWTFTNAEIAANGANQNISARNGTHYGTTGGKATASFQTKSTIATPGSLTCYVSKQSGNTTSSTWYIQVSSDGSTWTNVKSQSATSMSAGTWTEFTADLTEYTNVYVRLYYNGGTAIRNVDDISLEMASAVAKPTISGDESFLVSTEVSLECTTNGADIYYTTDESKKTHPSTSTWTAYDSNNKPSFDATTTIWVAATDGTNWSSVATSSFTKIVTWTVAEANYALGTSSPQNSKYVKGIISQIDNFSSPYITYWISDDGTTTDQLEVFKGKNLDNTNFSAISDLAIGDKVIVYGNLTIYKSTKEFSQDNYLVWKEAPTVATPTFTPNGGGFIVSADVTIECATANSSIYYTTNGGIPSKTTTLYESPIHITENTTIKAIAYVGDDKSIIVTKQFTLTEPMTVADAYDALTSDGMTNVGVHGIVYKIDEISNNNATYWISDDGEEGTKVLEVFRGKGLNGADVATRDIRVGDDVIVFGNLKIYNNTKEFDTGSRILSLTRKTVTAVAVSGTPDKDSYKTGESFDPAGLTVTVTYNDASSSTVDVADCSWAIDPETFDEAGEGISVSVKATYDDVQSSAFEVSGLTVIEAITFNNANYEWQLVTDEAQLVAGKYYVIASDTKGKVASTISGDILGTENAVFADGTIAFNAFGDEKTADASDAVVFELGGTSSAWTLSEVIDESGLLGFKDNKKVQWGGDATTWTIAIADNKATIVPIDADSYHILYNVNSPRFTVYSSDPAANMLLPQLYVWALKTYKLRYDANGGSNAPAAQVADGEGKATVTSSVPTAPANKVFDSWNTVAAGTGDTKDAGDVIDLTSADVTLYAQWRVPQTFQISYEANGGVLIDGKSALDSENVTEGAPYTVKANVYEKEGKIFTGWKVSDVTYYPGDEILPTGNMTFVAQWSDPNITDFVLVTDIKQLKDGDKVYIVAANQDAALGAQNSSKNYREQVEIAKLNNHVVVSRDEPTELTLGVTATGYTLKSGDKYIASNTVKNVVEQADEFEWSITITEEGVATISATVGDLKYNKQDTRFNTYASGQNVLSIYKKPDYDREITAGRYGTICLPKAGKIYGAIIFEIAYYKGDSKKIYFDEVLDGNMEAGMPYIFLPEEGASKLGVYYADVTAADAPAQNHNGLYGSYAKTQLDANGENYILYSNQYYLVNSVAYVGENRAYIKLGEVDGNESAPAPGRRRVSMNVNGNQVATGTIDAELTAQPMKLIIDNKLYILREGKMYDMTGNVVK